MEKRGLAVGRNGRNRRFDSLGRRQSYYSRDNRSTCPTQSPALLSGLQISGCSEADRQRGPHSLTLSVYLSIHTGCVCARCVRSERVVWWMIAASI